MDIIESLQGESTPSRSHVPSPIHYDLRASFPLPSCIRHILGLVTNSRISEVTWFPLLILPVGCCWEVKMKKSVTFKPISYGRLWEHTLRKKIRVRTLRKIET